MRGATVHPRADPRSDATPYQIARPAGSEIASQDQRCVRNESGETMKRNDKCELKPKSFNVTTWHAMLKEFGYRPYGSALMKSSVAQMKSKAYHNDFTKCTLAVTVDRIDFLGKDAIATLADPTGSIVATVLAEVFEGQKSSLEQGAVLMLKDVFAILYPERKASGYHIDIDHGLHLTIRCANVVRVFGVKEKINFQLLPLERAYIDSALLPPKVNHEILKRQRSAGVLVSNGTADRTSIREDRQSGRNLPSNLPPFRRPSPVNRNEYQGLSNGSSIRRSSATSDGQSGQSRNEIPPPVSKYRTLPQGSRRRQKSQELPRRIEASSYQQPSSSVARKRPPIQPALPPRSTQRHRIENGPSQAAREDITANMNDEQQQLDALLGSVDIDAIVASSQTVRAEGKENEPAPPVQHGGSRFSTTPHAKSAVIGNSQVVRASGKENESDPSIQPGDTRVSPILQANTAAKDATGIVANMDEKDLDELLDGLDGDDFV